MRVFPWRWSRAALLGTLIACAVRPARADEPVVDPDAPPPPPPPTVVPPALPPPGSTSPGWSPAGAPGAAWPSPPPGLGQPPAGPQDAQHRREKLPRRIVHKPGMPVFAGYRMIEERPKWPLALGLPFFGVGYVAAIAVGLFGGSISEQADDWAPMFIPVVGPFITLETAKKSVEFDGERVLMVGSALFQAVGLGITALRFTLPPTKVLVLGRTSEKKVDARLTITPSGPALTGTF